MQEWVGAGGVQQWAFSAGGRWQSNCVHARVATKNSRQSNWAYMKILYWRVRALGRTNVLRKVSFFLHRRCCHMHTGAPAYRCMTENADTVFWLLWDVKEMKEIKWEMHFLFYIAFCYHEASSHLEHHLWLRQWPKGHVEEALTG